MSKHLILVIVLLMFLGTPLLAINRDEQMEVEEAYIYALAKESHLIENYQISAGDILILKNSEGEYKIYNEDITVDPSTFEIIEDISTIKKYREKIDRQEKINKLIKEALSQIGKPYIWGTAGPNSFDCSGLTSFVFRKIGIEIPRASYTQCFSGEQINPDNMLPGDLVFFNITRRSGHVGIYLGKGLMIHAPDKGDVVKISPIIYQGRIYAVRRHIPIVK